MSLSIIIPAYNEEEVIEKVVKDYYAIVRKIPDSEMIVVNDCSTDNTLRILQKLREKMPKLKIVTLKQNSGHGIALMTGLKLACKGNKEYIFHVDSDNQFNSEDFWKLYKYRNKFNLISGYRVKRKDPLNRLIIAKILKFLILLRYGFKIKDANSPFKLIDKKSLCIILKKMPKGIFAPSIFIQIIARKQGMRTLELPVRHYARKAGKSWLSSFKLLRACSRNFKEIIFRI